jgi:LPXTG-site transpeptidase (sortase) family protein
MNISKLRRIIFRFIRFFGAALASFSLAAFIYSYTPAMAENISGKADEPVVKLDNNLDPGIKVAEEAHSFGVEAHFSVVIPSIKAYSNVIPNVDPFNKEEYTKALKEGVAHAKGTFFPSQGKTIYLFAHSTDSPVNITRFNAVFYSLKDLENGDPIVVYYKNHKFVYEVVDKVIVSAKDISWLNSDQDGETLILQTCYPPGTTWKRLLVIAKRVD